MVVKPLRIDPFAIGSHRRAGSDEIPPRARALAGLGRPPPRTPPTYTAGGVGAGRPAPGLGRRHMGSTSSSSSSSVTSVAF